MQEEKIKSIISQYTKISADQINNQTVIDRTALTSSIFLHRMYADLAKAGYVTAGYSEIKDYGTLLHLLFKQEGLEHETTPAIEMSSSFIQKYNMAIDVNPVGIDIEETGRMPEVSDFRSDKFYTMYFSQSEISYCILQPSPLVSFTGLFAVKEAIVKSNASLKNQPFNTIIIDHLPGGKPIHPDFYLSISHTANLAIAVAIQKNILAYSPTLTAKVHHIPSTNANLIYIVSFSAIILSIITLVLVILRY